MDVRIRAKKKWFGVWLTLLCAPCIAASSVNIVKVDLDTLIRAAATTPTQFAVPVPHILTARHCESGHLGGGKPSAANTVTVYWDAVSPCGQALGSLYDPGIATQTGATTIVEQQDAWLIRLDASPVVADAQFAGFDASGGAVQGGYTIQHSLGNDKQFTAWFGQALASQQAGELGVTYSSNFWEVVNQLGNIGPGASGSALIVYQRDQLHG